MPASFASRERLVDVVVGGQWGSEGKGHIANYLSPEYPTLMRVGGPNAGHYVIDDDGSIYCHRLLPSGSRRNHEPMLLIGPGATLHEDLLLKEIRECEIGAQRLMIHPQAAIISTGDILAEQSLVNAIGSTGQGGGRCASRRILRDGTMLLARDIPELDPYVGDTTAFLQDSFAGSDRVLLEGTQGTALSMFHGSYPHTTSRDTSVAGTCSEAGVSPARVDRVFMVIRTYPIRVGTGGPGVSGPMPGETTWEEVAKQAALDPDWLCDHERGSVSGITRRVANFDFESVHHAAELNGATDLALTFADYQDPGNIEARSIDDLVPETREFIDRLEDELLIPVSLISVGFNREAIIDRRFDRRGAIYPIGSMGTPLRAARAAY